MTYSIGDIVDYTELHWSSDWNGYEVGHNNVLVVGLYSSPDGEKDYYINSETGEVLEAFEAFGEEDFE